MSMGNLSIWLIFVLGIIVGGVLFSKDFREKFFRGFRRFLSGVGKGNISRASSGARIETRSAPRQRNEYEPAPKAKPKIIACPTCDGVGKVQKELPPIMKGGIGVQEKWVICPDCEGSGRVFEKPSPLQEGAPGFKPEAIDCPTCGGEGKVWD